MTEKVKESISALIDDELSEIEIHRLLRQYGENPDLKQNWIQYQQVGAAMRGEKLISSELHLDLHSKISDAIAEEAGHDGSKGIIAQPQNSANKWVKPASGFAVAASLAVAVFFGIQQGGQPSSDLTTPGLAENTNTISAPINVTPVSTGSNNGATIDANIGARVGAIPNTTVVNRDAMKAEEAIGNQEYAEVHPVLKELTPEAQEQLRQYLNRHEQMNRRNQNVRTVTFDKANGRP